MKRIPDYSAVTKTPLSKSSQLSLAEFPREIVTGETLNAVEAYSPNYHPGNIGIFPE